MRSATCGMFGLGGKHGFLNCIEINYIVNLSSLSNYSIVSKKIKPDFLPCDEKHNKTWEVTVGTSMKDLAYDMLGKDRRICPIGWPVDKLHLRTRMS